MKKLIWVSVLFLAAAPLGRASTSSSWDRWTSSCVDRFYLGFSLTRDAINGDFNGNLVLGNPEKAFFIPDLKPAPGFCFSYGEIRKRGLWAVSYSMTPYKASFQGESKTSLSHVFEVNGKGYLVYRIPIRPYVQIGFDLAWLHVRDGAIKGQTRYNANYLGLGVNGGVGFLVPINSRIFIGAGAVYRFFAYLYAKGPGKGRDVTNLNVDRSGPRRDIFLKGPGLRLEISLGYVL